MSKSKKTAGQPVAASSSAMTTKNTGNGSASCSAGLDWLASADGYRQSLLTLVKGANYGISGGNTDLLGGQPSTLFYDAKTVLRVNHLLDEVEHLLATAHLVNGPVEGSNEPSTVPMVLRLVKGAPRGSAA